MAGGCPWGSHSHVEGMSLGPGMPTGQGCPQRGCARSGVGRGTRRARLLPALCWQERLPCSQGFGVLQEGPNPSGQGPASHPNTLAGDEVPHPAPTVAGMQPRRGRMVPVGTGCRAGEGDGGWGDTTMKTTWFWGHTGNPRGHREMPSMVATKGLPSAESLTNPTPWRARLSQQPLPPPAISGAA